MSGMDARSMRMLAAVHRMSAERLEVAASCLDASAAMRRFTEAFESCAEAEFAGHPDVAEMDVRLESWYGQEWTA